MLGEVFKFLDYYHNIQGNWGPVDWFLHWVAKAGAFGIILFSLALLVVLLSLAYWGVVPLLRLTFSLTKRALIFAIKKLKMIPLRSVGEFLVSISPSILLGLVVAMVIGAYGYWLVRLSQVNGFIEGAALFSFAVGFCFLLIMAVKRMKLATILQASIGTSVGLFVLITLWPIMEIMD